MVDLEAIGREVRDRILRMEGTVVKDGGARLRFRCPVPQHDDAHPSADYYVDGLAWKCWACGAQGGLIRENGYGRVPIAPLLGIVVDGPIASADMAVIAAERAAIDARISEQERAKAVALADYWAAHREVVTLRARRDLLDTLLAEGISRLGIEQFGLGTDNYPVYHDGREPSFVPAIVIPWTVRGHVRALQYRLMESCDGGRYRWHRGSKATLFNADAVLVPEDDTITVVEGAKKCAALWSHGIVSVAAVANKTGWRAEWAPQLAKFSRVLFMLDPDAWTQARDAALTVPNARVVRLPMKPDDLLVYTDGDVGLLTSYMDRAERAA